MTVKEYKLHLLALDDDSIICVSRNKAVMLNKTLAGYVQRLIEEFQPEDKHTVIPPARSTELAVKANGPIEHRKYYMSKAMALVLNTMAPFEDPLTTNDVITLCSMSRGTASSKISMLTTNGYLTRVAVGKYLVSPAGHAYLLEHAAN